MHLACGQRCQGQHQSGMAGLHDDRSQCADQHEQQYTRPACHGKAGQIESPFKPAEAGLHQIDAEEQQADAEQRQPGTTPVGFFTASQKDTERQHRHRQLRHVQFETGKGDQPGAGSGAQVGTEHQPDTTKGIDQAGTEKGNTEQRNQGAGLHQGGTHDTDQHAFPQTAGAPLQPALQRTAGECTKTLFKTADSEHEQSDAGSQGGQLSAPDHQSE